MFGESFMKIIALKGRQDSTCPPGVLEDMEVPDTPPCGVKRSNMVLGMFCESFMTIGALKGHQDSSCPPSVLLESWRTWMFLRHLELVSKGLGHSQDCCLKVLYVFEECRNNKIH